MSHRDMPIRKRIASHDEFVLKNKNFLDQFFSPERWKLMTFGRIRNEPHGIYCTKKSMKAEMKILGEILKKEFDYGCKTNAFDVCLHFKRRYNYVTEKVCE